MKHTAKFKVRRVTQEAGKDGKIVDRVGLERTDESDAIAMSVSLSAPSPSGFRPEQPVLVTVETQG